MLKIGLIEYANCVPIFSALKDNFDCGDYDFIGGVPAVLNKKLSEGGVDVSPSSSIEYGKSFEKYYILPDLSISSIGAVKSVLLFSRIPIEQLDGLSIGLTTESDTSVALLKIILSKFHGFSNTFVRTTLPLDEALDHFPAMLMIGDLALKGAATVKDAFVYDLGELWRAFTGLPFVFALWIVRREAVENNRNEVISLCKDLLAAKSIAYGSLGEIAAKSREAQWMGVEGLVDYWRCLSYDLTPLHMEGLRTFFFHAVEIGVLERTPEFKVVG